MKPERWQQLDRLFHSALEHEFGERASYLDQACAGDLALRNEVEALLTAHQKASRFLEQPALELEAEALAEELPREVNALREKTIGHYRIVEPIGSGGMGEVYLAQDITLGRHVALKLLPGHFTSDPERLRRFEQEARAASALNHPNILTIYEIGNADSIRYIATEFIDGLTLRERMAGRPMKTEESLDLAIQVASALAAAHAKGIIHRDIKPENIMISRPGHLAQKEDYVKMLDFGIAKLTEPQVPETEMPTRLLVSTSQGITMGTAPYMSPEQVRGDRVDARTDIWSLGAVLYEMLAGERPFTGEKSQDISASILKDEPLPLPTLVPDGLKSVVNKALRKNREDRYQTAGEMFAELRNLQTATGRMSVATRSTFIRQRLTSAIGRRRRASSLATLAVIALTAGAYGIYRVVNKKSVPPISFRQAKWARITTTGKVTQAVISPDGKYLVHVVEDRGQQSLRLRQIATTTDKEIIEPAPVTYGSLTFTPDGNYIYYALMSGDMPLPTLYRVSTLGGDSKKVPVRLEGEWVDLIRRGPVSFSPDGLRFVFRRIETGKETAIMIANADGSGEQKLVAHSPPQICGHPAWSPDGKTIAYVVGDFGSNETTVVKAQVTDGASKPLASQKWFRIGRMAWLADGSGLLMLAASKINSAFQIWHVPLEGEARNLSNDLNNYVDLSLTADTSALATVQAGQQANIWIAPAEDASRARQITSVVARTEGGQGMGWTPDGRIVYSSVTSDTSDIWIIDADGKNQRPLTANARINNQPSVSPDGRYVFFLSDRTGVPHIWRMDLDGGDLNQLTNGPGEQNPSCSPEGRWVVFRTVFGELTIWRVPVEGGQVMQLTNKPSIGPAVVSPDSREIGYLTEESGSLRIAIMPFDGGAPLKTYEVPPTLRAVGGVRWTPDGSALAYAGARDGVSNIWIQPLEGGEPKKFTDFKSERIFAFDWSRDGKQLALSRGGDIRDVILISNFR